LQSNKRKKAGGATGSFCKTQIAKGSLAAPYSPPRNPVALLWTMGGRCDPKFAAGPSTAMVKVIKKTSTQKPWATIRRVPLLLLLEDMGIDFWAFGLCYEDSDVESVFLTVLTHADREINHQVL
jgi:hypothetical protein